MRKLLYFFSLLLLIYSCYNEDNLIASTENEKGFIFPQGNTELDNKLVEFKNKYNTYFLYKFDKLDFSWGVTTNYHKDFKDGNYSYTEANFNYVDEQINFVESNFLNYYTTEFLKAYLPLKFLLTADISFFDNDENETPLRVFVGVDFIALSGAKESGIPTQKEELNILRAELNHAFLTKLFNDKTLPYSNDFMAVTDYTAGYINSSNYKNYGLLDYNTKELKLDWNLFLLKALSIPYSQMIEDDGILSSSNDPWGKIKKKMEIVYSYFLTNYKIDLKQISNEAL